MFNVLQLTQAVASVMSRRRCWVSLPSSAPFNVNYGPIIQISDTSLELDWKRGGVYTHKELAILIKDIHLALLCGQNVF